jgi:5-(carboxyamino)imidazole ribonucleotide mutase
MISAMTPLPVLGVPVKSRALNGLDSLLSIVQMPGGVPTATFAVGESGALNAALFAIRMLSLENDDLAIKLDEFIQKKASQALSGNETVQARLKSGDYR